MTNIDIEVIYQRFLDVQQRICTDTRKDIQQSMFFCLKGTRFDSNLFINDALNSGADWIISNRRDIQDPRIIHVDNPNETLIALASFHASKLSTKFIAIGGSNGKTTTKELVNRVLQDTYKTQCTQGNFNNDIGVPLTILSFKQDLEIGIVELGTNHPGEMQVLCDIFKMNTGLLTNIGLEHLEGFGDIETVALEESTLYLKAQKDQALVFVNKDDTWLFNMSHRLNRKNTFSLVDPESDVFLEVKEEMPNLKLCLHLKGHKSVEFQTQLGGRFNAYNIASAIAVGLHYQVELNTIITAVSGYIAQNNRSQWLMTKETHILLDAYNANPSSVESGLRSFSTLTGKKTLLLGDMLELGNQSKHEHQRIFKLAIELGFEEIYLVGHEFLNSVPEFPFTFVDCNSLLAWLDTHPIKTDYVYIKGSRGISMEKCLEHFDLKSN
jgi:UDP-N-acetylmuramoyl-tripeptide--D-alanyl-D-alanine ligase